MTNNMNFTVMLGNVMTELEPEFKFFHTQEEAKILLHTITERAKYNNSCIPYGTKNSMIDSYIIQQDKRLRLLFNEAANDYSASNEKEKAAEILKKFRDLPEKMTSLTNYSGFKEEYKDICDEIIALLISVDDMDCVFLSKLANHLDEFASSKDYMRRLVIHRLYEISPEFICEKDKNGELITDEEGKYIFHEPDKLPSTRLLIMKQFIKQYHWCENVDTAGGAKDKKAKGYNCEVIRQLCENAYLGDYGKMAYEIDENFFKLLGIKSGDSSEQKAADDYIANILLINGSNINVIDKSDIVLWKNIKIIEMADSLEKALFDDSGNTPLKLYMFAIAFDMDVQLSSMDLSESSSESRFKDIRKNLFYDFYCENLVNYLTGSNEKIQTNITGYGINVKNFAEIIFVYFLIKKDMSALEKLLRASKMISDCCEAYRDMKKGKFTFSEDKKNELETEFNNLDEAGDPDDVGFDLILTKMLVSSDALKKLWLCDEETFKQLILKKWNLSYFASAFKGESNYHETAADHYSELEKQIRSVPKEVRKVGIVIGADTPDPRIELLVDKFNVLAKREEKLRKWYMDRDEDSTMPPPQEYRPVIGSNKSDEDKNDEASLEPPVIDRGTLLFALSDNFVLKIKSVDAGKRNSVLANYHSFYRYFCDETNAILIDCGFQEIVSKNIFDLLLVYLTYKKCNI